MNVSLLPWSSHFLRFRGPPSIGTLQPCTVAINRILPVTVDTFSKYRFNGKCFEKGFHESRNIGLLLILLIERIFIRHS